MCLGKDYMETGEDEIRDFKEDSFKKPHYFNVISTEVLKPT